MFNQSQYHWPSFGGQNAENVPNNNTMPNQLQPNHNAALLLNCYSQQNPLGLFQQLQHQQHAINSANAVAYQTQFNSLSLPHQSLLPSQTAAQQGAGAVQQARIPRSLVQRVQHDSAPQDDSVESQDDSDIAVLEESFLPREVQEEVSLVDKMIESE